MNDASMNVHIQVSVWTLYFHTEIFQLRVEFLYQGHLDKRQISGPSEPLNQILEKDPEVHRSFRDTGLNGPMLDLNT
jgi:hypothetical protein